MDNSKNNTWQSSLPEDFRQQVVECLGDILGRQVLPTGQESIGDMTQRSASTAEILQRSASRVEEHIFDSATDQQDYLQMITTTLRSQEAVVQVAADITIPVIPVMLGNPAAVVNSLDPGATVPLQNQAQNVNGLQLPGAESGQAQQRQQLLAQSLQNNLNANVMPSSTGLGSNLSTMTEMPQAALSGSSGQNRMPSGVTAQMMAMRQQRQQQQQQTQQQQQNRMPTGSKTQMMVMLQQRQQQQQHQQQQQTQQQQQNNLNANVTQSSNSARYLSSMTGMPQAALPDISRQNRTPNVFSILHQQYHQQLQQLQQTQHLQSLLLLQKQYQQRQILEQKWQLQQQQPLRQQVPSLREQRTTNHSVPQTANVPLTIQQHPQEQQVLQQQPTALQPHAQESQGSNEIQGQVQQSPQHQQLQSADQQSPQQSLQQP